MSRRHVLATVSVVSLVTFAGLLALAIVMQLTTDHTAQISTSIAVPKPAAPREVKSVLTDASGDLIITYTDGTTQNAGRVRGSDGSGQAPTQAQISIALIEYCTGGKCDSKTPTQQQIVDALNVYCSGGKCRGADGQSASPITAEQIASAVATFCADGRCRGADGQAVKGDKGDTGMPGSPTVLNCVIRGDVRYVAWKYSTETDDAYRNLYKLPTWAECTNPITLS